MANTQKSPKGSKKKYNIFIRLTVILVLIILFIWGLAVFFHIGDKDYTEDAQVEQYVNPISTKVAGYLNDIRFDEHQKVAKGDTIAIIDDREYKIALEQAVAALQQARAGRTVVHADLKVSENVTNISEANIQEAKARLDNQQKNLERYAQLLKADVIPQFDYDQQKTESEAM